VSKKIKLGKNRAEWTENTLPVVAMAAVGLAVGRLALLPGPSYYPMSQASPPVTSRSNYRAIFDGALEAYKKKTGNDLVSNPLFHSIETCNSPDAVLAILQAQILEPGQSQNSRNKLTTWLDPTVNVLNTFSATIGGFVGLVSLKEYEMTRPESAV
jgi:hypothetical protein